MKFVNHFETEYENPDDLAKSIAACFTLPEKLADAAPGAISKFAVLAKMLSAFIDEQAKAAEKADAELRKLEREEREAEIDDRVKKATAEQAKEIEKLKSELAALKLLYSKSEEKAE